METIVQAINKAMKSGAFDLDEADAILKALKDVSTKLREAEVEPKAEVVPIKKMTK